MCMVAQEFRYDRTDLGTMLTGAVIIDTLNKTFTWNKDKFRQEGYDQTIYENIIFKGNINTNLEFSHTEGDITYEWKIFPQAPSLSSISSHMMVSMRKDNFTRKRERVIYFINLKK